MSTNDVASGESSRNFAMSPMPSTPTTGQKSSSKTRNTLRSAIWRLRRANAATAMSSPRQLNEDLLELGLADLDVAHDRRLRMERGEDLRQALLRVVHGALDAPGDDRAAK